ncbi:hypothetical protein OK348_05630 [Flavobacterium sp. MXW15]|nr:hypothetical protein [Flavobacterium sp. MXW15]
MNVATAQPLWSEQQQSWLQAMGYTVYLEGGAAQQPEPAVEPVVAAAVTPPRSAPAPARPVAPVRRAPPPMAADADVDTAPAVVPAPAQGRRPSVRLPDRLQIALLRASACNPSDPETRQLMDSWPLAELRGNPAAKRALWPQLRALRRKRRQ